jgi:hypothetical protein
MAHALPPQRETDIFLPITAGKMLTEHRIDRRRHRDA